MSLAAAAAFVLAGCNNVALSNNGRLVGFVVNGVSNAPINMFPKSGALDNLGNDPNAKDQVYVLLDGAFKRASPCGQGDINASNGIPADGCYTVASLPVNTPIPVFAIADGFDPFQSSVTIAESSPAVMLGNAAGGTGTVGPQPDPEVIGNIRLFTKGLTIDYHVLVTASNQPVTGAVITCQRVSATADSFQSTSGSNFLAPENTNVQTVTATTDANGNATLPGAQLVLGAAYNCNVTATSLFENRTESLGTTGEFTAGVTDTNLFFALTTNPGTALFAVTSNVDLPVLLGANGQLIINLNQPAQTVAGADDCWHAALSAPDSNHNLNTIPTLAADVTGNNSSENATVSITGNTLTIGFKGLTGSFDSGDLGTTVSFSGIFIQPTVATQITQIFNIGGAGGSGSSQCALGAAYGGSSALSNERTGGAQSSTIRLF